MLSRLTRISEEFNVAMSVRVPSTAGPGKLTRPPLQYSFVANQVQSDPGANAMFAGADKKPIGACIAPDSFLEC